MSFTPTLNTVAGLKTTYSSPRGYQRSYKTSPTTSAFGTGSFRPSGGGSTNKDNWILGKGASEHDGWDGWSVVQGEKRYWDSKLGKPEFRGKCGGAAANRLSEEKIIRKLGTSTAESLELPPGVRRTDLLLEQRRQQIAAVSDELFREYFPDLPLTPRGTVSLQASSKNNTASSPTQVGGGGKGPNVSGGGQRSPLKTANKGEVELTPDIGSGDVDRSRRVIRRKQQQAIPDPPQRCSPLHTAMSPRSTNVLTSSQHHLQLGVQFSIPSPPHQRQQRVSDGVGSNGTTRRFNIYSSDDEPSFAPTRGVGRGDADFFGGDGRLLPSPRRVPSVNGVGDRVSSSLAHVPPAGMPTNGTYHQHLPSVPSSPRRK